MRKVLFIAALLCLVSITSCTTDSIEDIQQQEQLQQVIEDSNIYARDTGKDDAVNSEGSSGSDEDDNSED